MAPPPAQESRRRFPWARLLIASAALLVLLPCLGLACSLAYSTLRQAGDLSRWQSLGGPPEGGAEIVAGDPGVVYVRSKAGQVYGCEPPQAVAGGCWREAREPYQVDPKAVYDSPVYQGEVEPPPGNVVDRLDVTIWQAEDAFEARYALLEDGTVWKWEYDVGAYFSLGLLLLGPAAGLAIAILAAVALWLGVGLGRSTTRRP